MSATLGDTSFFEEALTRLTGKETVTVKSGSRPVPLDHAYSDLPLPRTVESLAADGKAPVYAANMETITLDHDLEVLAAHSGKFHLYDQPAIRRINIGVGHPMGVRVIALLPRRGGSHHKMRGRTDFTHGHFS